MFSEGWQPLAFSEVNSRMSAAGLQFVGDSEILENLPEHCTLTPWTEKIAAVSDRVEQESLKDLIHNRTFRRDVFRRPRSEHNAKSDEPLLSTLLCTMQPAAQVSPRVMVTGGTLDMSGGWFERLREILDLRILSIEEILNDPVLAGCPRSELLNGLKLAAIDGAIGPAVLREASTAQQLGTALQVAPVLNRTLLERFSLQRPQLTLASPVTGRGVTVGGLEAMVLASIGRPSPEHWMLQQMQAAGRSLKPTGTDVRVESTDEQLAALRHIADEFFRVRVPKLASLGILVPPA
jgi:hypothetical protein